MGKRYADLILPCDGTQQLPLPRDIIGRRLLTRVGEIVVDSVARHLNQGAPFHAIAFRWYQAPKQRRRMLASVFPAAGEIAVYDLDLLAEGRFGSDGSNDFAGRQFEPELRAVIADFERERV